MTQDGGAASLDVERECCLCASGDGSCGHAGAAGEAGGQQWPAGQDQQGAECLPGKETTLLPTVSVLHDEAGVVSAWNLSLSSSFFMDLSTCCRCNKF